MKVTIDVTQEDILNGKREDGCFCPIALAAKRVLPGCPELLVDSAFFYLAAPPPAPGDFPKGPYVSLPDVAQDFIFDFDGRCTCSDPSCDLSHVLVGPFSFVLDVPDALLAEVAQ